MELMELAEKLNAKGFLTQVASDLAEARKMVRDLLADVRVLGKGGSMTLVESGIMDELEKMDIEILSSEKAKEKGLDRLDYYRRAMNADAYICSANAVTEAGDIINIDGTGNRVGAIIYGPKKLIMVIGKNKITKNPHTAIARIKKEACPKNAQRMGLTTPCGLEGVCGNCNHPNRMCNVTMRMEYALPNREMHVILVDENLGY